MLISRIQEQAARVCLTVLRGRNEVKISIKNSVRGQRRNLNLQSTGNVKINIDVSSVMHL